MAMQGQGSIIGAALELIKEKEKQADKASARISDGIAHQADLTANQGSWTGGASSTPKQVVKEKEVVKEVTKEPEEESPKTETPTAPGADDGDDDKKGGVADMGIVELAQGASK